MERKFEIAARTLQVSFDLFLRMGTDARRRPVREERYTHNGGSSESLEVTVVWDRVQRCHLLTSFQEGLHQKLFFQGTSKFCK